MVTFSQMGDRLTAAAEAAGVLAPGELLTVGEVLTVAEFTALEAELIELADLVQLADNGGPTSSRKG